jgi:hypothetical protein
MIPTRGWTRVDRTRALLLVLFGGFIGAIFWRGFSKWGVEVTAVAEGLGVGCLFLGGLLSASRSSVRRITIDQKGVTFTLPFRSEMVPWFELIPSGAPANRGLWGVLRASKTDPHRGRPFLLTAEQGRAILNFPGRPKWKISARVAQSLGVAPASLK